MNKPVISVFKRNISLHAVLYMLYFFLAPMEDILNNSAGTLGKYLAVVIVAVTLIENRGEISIKNTIANKCIIWLMLITVASMLWTTDKQTTSNRMVAYLLVPGFCLFTSLISFTREEFNWIVLAAIAGGIVASAVAFLTGNMLGETMASRLILTEDNDPNNFAALLLLPFALSWWKIQESHKFYQKMIFVFALAIIVFFIFMTGSRGGMLSILMILVSYYILSGMYKRATTIIGTALLLVVLIYFLKSYLPADLYNRLFTLKNYTSNGAGRTGVWEILFSDIIPNMGILGLGPGCVSNKLVSYYGFAKGIHNTYLNMLCEFGILGLPAFLLMIVSILVRSHKRKFYIGMAMLLGICTTILFLDAYAKKFFWNIIMLIFIHEGIEEASDTTTLQIT